MGITSGWGGERGQGWCFRIVDEKEKVARDDTGEWKTGRKKEPQPVENEKRMDDN